MRSLALLALLTCALLAQPPAGGGQGGGQGGGPGGPGFGASVPESLRPAQRLLREGKAGEAIALYQQYIKANPTSVPALNALANALDMTGRSKEAKPYFQRAIDAAPNAQVKAQAQRAMAMSYAFDNDCQNAARLLEDVFAYWVKQGDFYQQGEMSNEAARVCIEAGDLKTAETLYRRGTEVGLKEPNIKPERTALWHFRLEHALGRLAARRQRQAEAAKHIAAARKLLDENPGMAKQQETFYPYLTGYVALYLGDAAKAAADFEKANQNDPFIQVLQSMAYEKLGQKEKAREYFAKAAKSMGHNPPAAFASYYTRTHKL